MKTLDDVIIRIGAMESLTLPVEKAIEEAIFENGETPALDQVQNLFYILAEQVRAAKEELDEAAGHVKVCNALYAVNHVKELKAEVESLKAEVERLKAGKK